MRRNAIALVIVLAATGSACTRMVANAVSERIVNDQLSMTTYRGRYVERHDGGRTVKAVQYQRPYKVRVEVVEPAERRGELVIYDGTDLTMWWPRARLGVKVKGLTLPDESAIRELVKSDTLSAWDKYHFSSMGAETVAGRSARRWQAVPKQNTPDTLPYSSWMDRDYTIPLKMSVRDAPDHLFYEMMFEEIAFDVPLEPNAFHIDFPEDAVVTTWDLGGPGLTREAMARQLNFELLVPTELPPGLEVTKIVRGDTGVPMAAVVMQKGARLLTLTEMHGFGRTIDLGSGIPVRIGDETGYLNLTGSVSSLAWYAGDTVLTLIGNLPYPEMIAMARRVTPKQATSPKGLLDIQTYRGRMVEERRGVRLTREVTFEAPGRFRTEVTSPAAHAGETAVYDGETLTMWWPRDRFAIRVRGIAPPTSQQVLTMLRENTLWSLGRYATVFEGADEVAGRRVDHWSLTPVHENPGAFATQTWLDAETALPLKVAIDDRDKTPWFAMTYEHIAFDEPVPTGVFSLALPKDAVIFDWDLSDPHVPDATLETALNFDLLLPKKLPRGIGIHKVIRGRSGVPMAAVLMNREGRWLSLTETRFFGHAVRSGTGLPVAVGDRRGYLDFLGTFVSLSWSQGNTRLTLIGNLPYPQMVEIAASVVSGPTGDRADVFSVESYRGRYEERFGTPATTIFKEVSYRAPGKFRVEVLEPRQRRGELVTFDGTTLTMWWPRHLFGVRIRGLDTPGPEALKGVAARNAMWSLRHHRFAYRGQGIVAKRKTDRFVLEPSVDQPYLLTNETAFDRETALPLAVELGNRGEAPWYSMTFDDFTVGEPVDDHRFSPPLPRNAVIFDWDLRDPGRSIEEMQRLMNFPLLVPTELPEGLSIQKIVKGRHQLPMAVILMGRDGVRLSLTENRRATALRRDSGIPVEVNGNRGYLNFLGPFTSITWHQGNTALTLIGNLPYPELLAVAASVKKPD